MPKTVTRVGEVLSLFSESRTSLTIGDVVRKIEVSRSAARVLLASMVDVHLLNQLAPGRYELGQSVAQLTDTLLSSAAMTRVAFPLMTELNSSIRESFELVVNQGGVARVVDCVTGTFPVAVRMSGLGTVRELHCTATGKIVLAWTDDHDPTPGIVRPNVYTPRTLNVATELDTEIKIIRQRGVAFDRGEFVEEVCCFACPILSSSGVLLGAIGMATPAHRFNRSLSIAQPLVAAAAHTISRAMDSVAARR